jgi:hypothetical protein
VYIIILKQQIKFLKIMTNFEQAKPAGKQGKKKERDQREAYRPGHYMTPEWEKNHADIVREINHDVLPSETIEVNGKLQSVTVSTRRFQKTEEERAAVKHAIKQHKADCKKYKVNRKKQMNVTIEDIVAVRETLSKKYKVVK